MGMGVRGRVGGEEAVVGGGGVGGLVGGACVCVGVEHVSDESSVLVTTCFRIKLNIKF